MSPGGKPQKRPDLIVREIEDETVVWDPRGKRIHHLNRTASFIWGRCNGRQSIEAIANQMARAFACDPEAVQADAKATLEQLAAAELLKLDSTGADKPSHDASRAGPRSGKAPPPALSSSALAVAAGASDHCLTLTALGCGICVDLPGPELLTLFQAAYGGLRAQPSSIDLRYSVHHQQQGPGFVLSRNGSEVGTAADTGELIWLFDGDLCVELQTLRSQLYFLHAAVLGLEGRGCVFVGGPGAGKSTLSWALCHHGFEYLSDELAPMELEELAVRPFPRSIALKDDPSRPYRAPAGTVFTSRTLHIPPEAMPSPLAADTLPLAALFLIDHDPSAAQPILEPISAAKAATHVFTHALNPLAHPAAGVDAAIRIASSCPCFGLVAAGLEDSCRLVKSLLMTPATPASKG